MELITADTNLYQYYVNNIQRNKHTETQQNIIKNNTHLLQLYPTFDLYGTIIPGYSAETIDETKNNNDDEWTEEDVILFRYYKQQQSKLLCKNITEYKSFLDFFFSFTYAESREEYKLLSKSLEDWGFEWKDSHYNRKKLDANKHYPQWQKYFII
jgi:hypothetical protein